MHGMRKGVSTITNYAQMNHSFLRECVSFLWSCKQTWHLECLHVNSPLFNYHRCVLILAILPAEEEAESSIAVSESLRRMSIEIVGVEKSVTTLAEWVLHSPLQVILSVGDDDVLHYIYTEQSPRKAATTTSQSHGGGKGRNEESIVGREKYCAVLPQAPINSLREWCVGLLEQLL